MGVLEKVGCSTNLLRTRAECPQTLAAVYCRPAVTPSIPGTTIGRLLQETWIGRRPTLAQILATVLAAMIAMPQAIPPLGYDILQLVQLDQDRRCLV